MGRLLARRGSAELGLLAEIQCLKDGDVFTSSMNYYRSILWQLDQSHPLRVSSPNTLNRVAFFNSCTSKLFDALWIFQSKNECSDSISDKLKVDNCFSVIKAISLVAAYFISKPSPSGLMSRSKNEINGENGKTIKTLNTIQKRLAKNFCASRIVSPEILQKIEPKDQICEYFPELEQYFNYFQNNFLNMKYDTAVELLNSMLKIIEEGRDQIRSDALSAIDFDFRTFFGDSLPPKEYNLTSNFNTQIKTSTQDSTKEEIAEASYKEIAFGLINDLESTGLPVQFNERSLYSRLIETKNNYTLYPSESQLEIAVKNQTLSLRKNGKLKGTKRSVYRIRR